MRSVGNAELITHRVLASDRPTQPTETAPQVPKEAVGSGADMFLRKRARRFEIVRAYHLSDKPPAVAASTIHDRRVQRPASDLVNDILLHEVPMPAPRGSDAYSPASLAVAGKIICSRLPRFRPALLSNRTPTRPSDSPSATLLPWWLRRVSVYHSVGKQAQGTFHRPEYNGASLSTVKSCQVIHERRTRSG